MNEFEKLIAFLKIAYHNMTTLHRHLVKDAGWFCNHEKLGEWYDEIAAQLDDLVEVGLALSFSEPSIKDAVLMFNADVLSCDPRDLRETFGVASSIMRSIAGQMQSAESVVPASVVNKLQDYEYGWNKIANYMIAHAMGVNKTVEMEDDD